MGIKLKSNKKKGISAALLLVLAATAVFFSLYPSYGERAENFYEDTFHDEEFLNSLFMASCVLYKDIQEKAGGKAVTYQELYVDEQDEQAEDTENISIYNQSDIYEQADIISRREDALEWLEWQLKSWRDKILDGPARQMDYCVIDHTTGISIRNTSRELEELAAGKNKELEKFYSYYVMVSFDAIGNSESLSVRSSSADKLLKTAQSVMQKKDIGGFINLSHGMQGLANPLYYRSSADGNLHKYQLQIKIAPRNATFIFALTADQMARQESWKYSNAQQAYYAAGAANAFRMILAVLAAAAFFLPLFDFYQLHKEKKAGLCLEAALFLMPLILSMGCEMAVMLMSGTNDGYFKRVFEQYLPAFPLWSYPVLQAGINFLGLFGIFSLWYYGINSFGQLWELGVREFVRQRSILYKGAVRLFGLLKKIIGKLWHELLHADLGDKTNKTIRKIVIIHFLIMAVICLMWMFGWIFLIPYTLALYIILKQYIKRIQQQYGRLLSATRSIAAGNLQTEFTGDWGIFESYKQELYTIQSGFQKAVKEEVKSQKMRTELITNVSHDLKTPLTAIITYVELLKEENITPQQRKEYLNVLEKKTARLKYLIEDLFEVSKANSGNVTLHMVEVDICNLMRQVYHEYEDKVEEADLIFRFELPAEKILLLLDSEKTYRVFENLYINIIKYAMPHTRVYIQVKKEAEKVNIQLKNMSAAELNIAPDELTERFVRGDASRNTEGSGLGLAIAKGFVELQKGRMEVEIDGDLFKVTLQWPLT